MSQKKLSGVMVSVLLLGLAACNNDDTALNTRNNDEVTNVVNRDNDNNNNNLYRLNNGVDYNRTPGINNSTTSDWNSKNNADRNPNTNPNSMISNHRTDMSSRQYPHTRPVLTQDARYGSVPVDPRQDTWQQSQFQQGRQKAVPAPTQEQQQQPTPAQQQQQTAPVTNSQAVQQVIDLTNAQRRQNGLSSLSADAKLNSVAQAKSVDMQQNNYFSHASPTYGSPFDMMRDQGVAYQSAGENIAKGQRTPQEVIQAWMNSEGHRKNILSPNYTHIGVGYDPNGHHWVQMFIEK